MKSYSELYLDDANDLMRLVFENVAKDSSLDFEFFVEKFMQSKYRRLMDIGTPRVINMSYNELLEYLHKDCPYLFRKGITNIDYLQAGWIGQMYNSIQYELNISSKSLYKLVNLKQMRIYFTPLHTIDDGLAAKRIVESIEKKYGNLIDEIHKQTINMNHRELLEFYRK